MDYSVSVVTSYHFQNKVRYWSKTPIFYPPNLTLVCQNPLIFIPKIQYKLFTSIYAIVQRYCRKVQLPAQTMPYGVVWHRTASHDVVRCRTATCVAHAAPYSVNGSPNFQSICGFLCREIGQVLISCRPLANRFELFNLP